MPLACVFLEKLRRGRRKVSAFTLTELLVVIVILGILAALVIPGVNYAMAASRSTGCMSNLRQIGTVMNLYADEHNDRYPTRYDDPNPDGSGTSSITWMWALKPYLNMDEDSMGVAPLPRAAGVFICPAFTPVGRNVSYGVHAWMGYNSGTGRWYYQRSILPLTKTIIVGEINENTETVHPAGTFGGVLVRRHPKDSANYLFADGHVENIKGTIPSSDARWFEP